MARRSSSRVFASLILWSGAAIPGVGRAGEAARVTLPPGAGTVFVPVTPTARVTVPAGRFTMGASRTEVQQARAMCAEELRSEGALKLEMGSRCAGKFEGEAPQTAVYVPAFAIDRREVTVSEYAACMRDSGCRPAGGLTGLAHGPVPVERVTWDDADSFCRWRGGRLPTEVEWEKAARGPGSQSWPWGASWLDGRANHGKAADPGGGGRRAERDGHERGEASDGGDGFEGRAPAGAFPQGRSPFGVEDMAGNVWEWTSTFFSRDPPQASTRFDPRGPVFASERTIRGGGYRSPPSDLRVTRRLGLHPEERAAGVGFRCAYDLRRE